MGFGCTNDQNSSMEEAKYVIEQLPDFQKHIQYFSISSGRAAMEPGDPFIRRSDPKLSGKDSKTCFIHVVIYEDKQGLRHLVFLDDSRPPKIVAKTK